MSRWVRLLLAVGLPLLGGCASLAVSRTPERTTAELTSAGHALGLPLHDPLDLSPERVAFLMERVHGDGSELDRARQLQRWLDDALPSFSYSEGESLTADEAWTSRRGDCFAKTNLFVAAARKLGVAARYTYVREVGRYQERSGYFVISSHVAAEVGPGPTPAVIDFESAPEGRLLYTYQMLTDAEATALFNSNLAVQHLMKGRPHLAELMLRFLVEQVPELPELPSNLAVVLIHLGHPEAAREVLREAITRFPTHMPLYTNAVAASLAMGDDPGARSWEAKGRAIANDDALFLLGVGLRRYTLHDYRGAAERFQRAAELQDDSAVAWEWLARARLAQGRVEDGRRALAKALRLTPDDPRLHDLEREALQPRPE